MFQTGSLYSQPPYSFSTMAEGAPAPKTTKSWTTMEVIAGIFALALVLVAARYGYKRMR